MQWKCTRVFGLTNPVILAALLVAPVAGFAQHGGGGGGGHGIGGGGGLSGGGRPSGVDAKDDLKDFHHAMAVQATPDQSAAYIAMIAGTEDASKKLHELAEQSSHPEKAAGLLQQATVVSQALDKARDENKKFVDGFSKPQKNGLKDLTKRIEKADSELAEQTRSLPGKNADGAIDGKLVNASAENVDKALTNFYNLQLSLGREMGVELPAANEEVTLDLPALSSPVGFRDQPITITTTGKIAKFAASDGQNSFKVETVVDLTDLQQNMTSFLRTNLDKSDTCGERLAIRRATMNPAVPSSFVVVQLHFERWTCNRTPGQAAGNQLELVEGDGSIALKLTPTIDKDGGMKLATDVTHTEGSGAVGEMIHSGSVGENLRENIAAAILAVIQKGIETKRMLPLAAQDHVLMKEAKFRDAGSGNLNIVVDGDLQISDDQFKLAAGQLKEKISAQGTKPQ